MNDPAEILILSNPKGSKKRIGEISAKIISILNSKNISFEHTDHWPVSIRDHKEVWLIGGDGTLHYFINHYPDFKLPIVIFKGGTGNDVAWKLYGDITVEEQLDLVLKANAKPIDAVRCNDNFFINGIGIGFDGEVLKSMRSIRMIGGHLGYLAAVIGKIFSFKELFFQINVDGEKFDGKYLLCLVCNSSRMGGGFMVSPKSDIADGKLNLILCKPLSILKRLRYLPAVEKGKHLDLSSVSEINAKQITITCNKNVPAQIDGELIYNSKFEIGVLPGKFLFKF